jgi:hypothetical protein
MAATGRLVVVDGAGPLAAETAHQLRRVRLDVRAGALAADAELAAGVPGPLPALVVLVRERPVAVWDGAPWQVRGVAHLPVVGASSTTVGPLVLPGRSPCLLCVARHRVPGDPPPPEPLPRDDLAGRVLAAAVVSVTALSVLRGEDVLAGISTEIGPGVETVRHRVWHVDTDCRCASVRMAG